MLWTIVPIGMFFSGAALPGLTSTRSSAITAVAGVQPLRRQDVGLLAVVVAQQRDERRPVRVVLEPLDRRADAELAALEVDQAVAPLVAAAAMPDRDPAGIVAPAALGEALGQRLDRLALPQLRAVDLDQLAQRRRDRLEASSVPCGPALRLRCPW